MLIKENLIIKKFHKLPFWFTRYSTHSNLFNLSIINIYNKYINNFLIYITFLEMRWKFRHNLYNIGLFWEKWQSKLLLEVNIYHQTFIKILYYITVNKTGKKHIMKLGIYYNRYINKYLNLDSKINILGKKERLLKLIPIKYYLNYFYEYNKNNEKLSINNEKLSVKNEKLQKKNKRIFKSILFKYYLNYFSVYKQKSLLKKNKRIIKRILFEYYLNTFSLLKQKNLLKKNKRILNLIPFIYYLNHFSVYKKKRFFTNKKSIFNTKNLRGKKKFFNTIYLRGRLKNFNNKYLLGRKKIFNTKYLRSVKKIFNTKYLRGKRKKFNTKYSRGKKKFFNTKNPLGSIKFFNTKYLRGKKKIFNTIYSRGISNFFDTKYLHDRIKNLNTKYLRGKHNILKLKISKFSNIDFSSSFYCKNFINYYKNLSLLKLKKRKSFFKKRCISLLKKKRISLKKCEFILNKLYISLLKKKKKFFFPYKIKYSYLWYNKLYNLYFYWYIFLYDNYLYFINQTFTGLWLSFFIHGNRIVLPTIKLYMKSLLPFLNKTLNILSDYTFYNWFTLNREVNYNLDALFLNKISYYWFFLPKIVSSLKDFINLNPFDNNRRSYKLFTIKKKRPLPIFLPFYKKKHLGFYYKKRKKILLPKNKKRFFSLLV